MPNGKSTIKRIDPDPIAIGALLMATLGVILKLESKIETRRELERGRRNTRARATISRALDEIQQSLSVFESFWLFFEGIGQTVAGPGEIGFGHAQKFLTEQEYSSVLDRLDGVLEEIGNVNRAVQRILFTPVDLDDVEPDALISLSFECRILREACNRSLFNGQSTTESFLQDLPKLLEQTRRFTRSLRSIIELDPPLA
jgi:hypothetical protein